MPSNKELQTEIMAISARLGLSDPELFGTNAELVERLAKLREKESAGGTGIAPFVPTGAPQGEEGSGQPLTLPSGTQTEEPEAPEQKASKGFVVAKGRSVTSLRGLLDQGAEVKPDISAALRILKDSATKK